MQPQPLTIDLLTTLKCPQGTSHAEFYDTIVPELFVDVLANGRMAFRVALKHSATQAATQTPAPRSKTIGDAHLLSIDEARELALQHLGRLEPTAPPSITLAHFYAHHYLPYVKSYKRSYTTDECTTRLHIIPALGKHPMNAVKPADIARLIESMRSRNYAAGTINRVLVLLRFGYNLALQWHIEGIEHNPASQIKSLRLDNKIERYLTTAQATALFKAVHASQNSDLADIVATLLYSGARLSEVLHMRWSDLNFQRRTWRIPYTKSGKIRHLPLSRHLTQLLTTRRRTAKPSPFVFANPHTAKPYTSIFYSWDTARRLAHLPQLRLHDLRHSFASFLVNKGRSLYEVQELLGHADIRTTSRYAHLSRERLRQAVEAVPSFSYIDPPHLR